MEAEFDLPNNLDDCHIRILDLENELHDVRATKAELEVQIQTLLKDKNKLKATIAELHKNLQGAAGEVFQESEEPEPEVKGGGS